jgi:Zn-dependent protease
MIMDEAFLREEMFFQQLFQDPIYFLRVVVIIIISIVIHELAHGVAALSQGDDTPQTSGHMTPNPIVHMGPESIMFLCIAGIAWGAMPINPEKFRHLKWSNILVSAAGPLSNLLLGSLCVAAWVGVHNTNLPVSQEFLQMAARLNMMLFLFNLLPVPPLDGFHIYSELIPGLKQFRNSPIALFLMMVMFLVPAVGKGLSMGSLLLVGAIAGALGMPLRSLLG